MQGQVCDAELLSLYFGLQIAFDKGAANLSIEMVPKVIVMLLKQTLIIFILWTQLCIVAN